MIGIYIFLGSFQIISTVNISSCVPVSKAKFIHDVSQWIMTSQWVKLACDLISHVMQFQYKLLKIVTGW